MKLQWTGSGLENRLGIEGWRMAKRNSYVPSGQIGSCVGVVPFSSRGVTLQWIFGKSKREGKNRERG